MPHQRRYVFKACAFPQLSVVIQKGLTVLALRRRTRADVHVSRRKRSADGVLDGIEAASSECSLESHQPTVSPRSDWYRIIQAQLQRTRVVPEKSARYSPVGSASWRTKVSSSCPSRTERFRPASFPTGYEAVRRTLYQPGGRISICLTAR